jgi:hypothetical protein
METIIFEARATTPFHSMNNVRGASRLRQATKKLLKAYLLGVIVAELKNFHLGVNLLL